MPEDPEISRRHARLTWRGGSWWLEDLGSTNGTFVGEFAKQQKITGIIEIATGHVFRVGLSRFRIDLAQALKDTRLMAAKHGG